MTAQNTSNLSIKRIQCSEGREQGNIVITVSNGYEEEERATKVSNAAISSLSGEFLKIQSGK